MLVILNNEKPIRCFPDEDKDVVQAIMDDINSFNKSCYIHVEHCPFRFEGKELKEK